MDPTMIIMLVLIVVLIFFMFRNGKKRQQAMQQMQDNLKPGAEVMLQSGIYGIVDSVDTEENKVTLQSGTSTLVVHRNAISQIVKPVEDVEVTETVVELAPDDDPAFGERLAESAPADPETTIDSAAQATEDPKGNGTSADDSNTGETPKA